MKLKNLIICCTIMAAASPIARADEGMWLPSLIANRIDDMHSKGFRLDAKDIYNINEASLKDAVVLFGGGCTGEIVSAEGLLLTNHHCGYSYIQSHSSVEHDYLRDGFWAMNRSEELPNPGLKVRILERMDNVTSAVLKGCSDELSAEENGKVTSENIKAIVKEAEAAGKGLKATVESMYYGNQYFLFIYKEYSDIRMVGAPPSSIGKFGGDTDNWVWPRHTGDFSMFRIYADKDNNPAEYSIDNVPYQPKKYFKIAATGIQEGDFTFIYGFPGSTLEYIHSSEVDYIQNVGDPNKIHLRTLRLDIIKRYMDSSQKIRIQYSSKYASISNAWKKWQGEEMGLRKNKTAEKKRKEEAAFSAWAEGTEYQGICNKLAALYKELEPYAFMTDYYNETARTIELASFASRYTSMIEDGSPDTSYTLEKFFKDWQMEIDKECFTAVMEEFRKNVPVNFQPDYFKSMISEYGDVSAWAESLFGSSLFACESSVKEMDINSLQIMKSDPAVVFARSFQQWYNTGILPQARRIKAEIRAAYKDYMRGQMEYAKVCGKSNDFYPDANLTLRVAYGHVEGYSPADGVYYTPSSTLKGIIEKDNPEIFDYNIPQILRDIYASGDFGSWTDANGQVPVCFLATNHTTGGNSGSPVINAEGNLIGINFDRVWEGTMSDIAFDPDRCRNISLDIRYVLFTLEKIAGAPHLIEEMTIIR